MTIQEIKDKAVDLLIDNMKISFDTQTAPNSRVCIFSKFNTTNECVKQKAVIDSIVALLTDNGYHITLDDIDIEQYKGERTGHQSVILRKED